MNEYITELVIGVLSVLGTLIGSYSGFKLTAYRVELLEKKVDKHNNFAERVPILEEQVKELRRAIYEK